LSSPSATAPAEDSGRSDTDPAARSDTDPAARSDTDPAAYQPVAAAELVWRHHGAALHLLACALLGDSSRAELEVAHSIAAFCARVSHVPPRDHDEARRSLARIVYTRCCDGSEPMPPPGLRSSTSPVLAWLLKLSTIQRTTLALCMFGAHDHHQAADVMGLPPADVATTLRAGMRAIGDGAAGALADTAPASRLHIIGAAGSGGIGGSEPAPVTPLP
jgi:hypothetical protein